MLIDNHGSTTGSKAIIIVDKMEAVQQFTPAFLNLCFHKSNGIYDEYGT